MIYDKNPTRKVWQIGWLFPWSRESSRGEQSSRLLPYCMCCACGLPGLVCVLQSERGCRQGCSQLCNCAELPQAQLLLHGHQPGSGRWQGWEHLTACKDADISKMFQSRACCHLLTQIFVVLQCCLQPFFPVSWNTFVTLFVVRDVLC